MSITRRAAVAAAVAAVVTTSACGAVAEKAGEKAGERLAEEAIENQSGGSADVDISDGGVKITDGEGGTYEVDADGNISGSSGDGDYQIGAGADLPEGWPEALAPPSGAEIISAITSGDSMSVVAKIDAPIRDVYDALKGQLEGAGYEISSDTYTSADSGDYALIAASGQDLEVSVSIASDSPGQGGAVATMSLQKVAG
jgi:hypothetical protein